MPKKIPISVLIMTKDEELNIRQCLESVGWADEIVVVDSGSRDKTLDIVKKHTSQIYQYRWDGKHPKKAWSLKTPRFKNDWILMLDADERATAEFRNEIGPIVAKQEGRFSGYVVRYRYWFLDRYIRFGDPVKKLVLFKKSKACFESHDISGTQAIEALEVGHEHPIIDGDTGFMKNPLLHKDARPLYYYFDRHNRYSTWEAFLLSKGRYKEVSSTTIEPRATGGWLNLRRFFKYLFLHLPLKPLLYFFYSYVLRLGFLDGYAGLAYNICKSFYAFQIGLKAGEFKRKEEAG